MNDNTQSQNMGGSSSPENVPPVKNWTAQERWVGIFKSPSAAMTSIAEKPNYAEPAFAVLLQVILTAIALGMAMTKIHYTGPYAARLESMVTSMIVGTMILAGFLMFLFWAIRAGLILILCRGDSDWQFKSAAAVTGYALVPTLLISIVTMVIVAIVLPSITLDTSNLEAAQQAMATFSQQTADLKYAITVPFTIGGIVWQAFLGAFGVRAGTKGQRSFAVGFVVFFLVGLIDLLLMFL